MKKGTLPDLLFVSPIGNSKHKIRHKHVVFVIEEWDEQGRPRRLVLANEDEVFDVEKVSSSGREFMTGYIQEHMTQPHQEKRRKKSS